MKGNLRSAALMLLGASLVSLQSFANTMIYKSEAASPAYNDPLALTIYTPGATEGMPYEGAITHLEMALIGDQKELFLTTYFTHQLNSCNPNFKQTMTFHIRENDREVPIPFEAHCELPGEPQGQFLSAVVARPSTDQARQYLIEQLSSQPSVVITHHPDGERNTRTTTIIELNTDGFNHDWKVLKKAI